MNPLNKLATLLLLPICLAALSVQAAEEHQHNAPEPVQVLDGHAVYGEPMAAGLVAVPLATALTVIDDSPPDAPLLLAGRIGQVCQKKGCWMMLTDGDVGVRVRFGDHAFTIPTDSAGAAMAMGTLTAVELSEHQAKHMAEDSGDDPSKVRGAQQEWELTATSVLILAER